MQTPVVQCCWQDRVWWSYSNGPLALHKSVRVFQRCRDPTQLMMRGLLLVIPRYTPANNLAAVICPSFLLCLVVPAHNLSHICV